VTVATWQEFARQAPEMAARGYQQLSIPVAYLATVRKNGAPRLHPLSPMFADGRLFVAIGATAPRRHDLARDGRYSLHAILPDLGPDYDEFEFNITGHARRVTDAATRATVNASENLRGRPTLPEDDWLFELDIAAALTTVWDHTMEQRDGMWLPVLGEAPPKPARRIWKETGSG
jgi:hypothetical protein